MVYKAIMEYSTLYLVDVSRVKIEGSFGNGGEWDM